MLTPTGTDPGSSWKEHAACRGMETNLFFAELDGFGDKYAARRKIVRDLVALCSECPVKQKCLDYAFFHNIKYGIWGGVSASNRDQMSRRMRKNNKNKGV